MIKSVKILFENAKIITMEDSNPFVECGYIATENDKIAYVGKERPTGEFNRVINATGKVIMPGLVNTHTHIPMTLFRGLSDDCDLQEWLFEHIFPAEDKLTDEKVRAGTRLAVAEMLASGTTSFSDSYFFTDAIVDEVIKSGICGNIARSIVGDGEDFENMPSVSEMKSLLEKVKTEGGGRVRADIAIHAEYTTEAKCRIKVSEYARKNNLVLQIHTSESKSEHEECIQKHGKTPTELFLSEGLLEGANPLLAHCCYITERDMDIIKSVNGSVAHCPISNLKLASGVAPVLEMMKKGVNVTLGTDGVASNNNTDMFEEIKLFAILHKGISRDPKVIDAYTALKTATVNGAMAQRRFDTGMLKSGFKANLIMLDFEKPHLKPCYNVISNVTYSAKGSDVVLTMCEGKILYENGDFKTIDIERAMAEIERIK